MIQTGFGPFTYYSSTAVLTMATTGSKEKWTLFYDEKNFRSFEKLLLIELLNKDYFNKKFLNDKYAQ